MIRQPIRAPSPPRDESPLHPAASPASLAEPPTLAAKPAEPRKQIAAAPPPRRRRGIFRTLVASLLLVASGYFGWAAFNVSVPPADRNAEPATLVAPNLHTTPIQDITVGAWVLADNPELKDVEDEYGPINPAKWRNIALRLEKPGGGTLDIDLLRPLPWLDAKQARVGGLIHLRLEELGIDGPAEVLSITSCPPLSDRPSKGHRLVTGKFAHSAGNVIDLHIEGLEGPIGTTANHPFWSVDREKFVQAGTLKVGEHLLLLDGRMSRVIRMVARADAPPVFNLEVETEHVFYVSASGVLVHNARDYDADEWLEQWLRENDEMLARQRSASQFHHPIPWDNSSFPHWRHDLVKRAGLDKQGLRDFSSNLMELMGHGGKHSPGYHATVDMLMDRSLKKVDAGEMTAKDGLEWVIKKLRQGIADGSIKPYDNKEVFPL